MLLAVYDARRPTVDADLLAHGFPNDDEGVLARVRDIAAAQVPDDGVHFHADTARAGEIRGESLHSGVRVTLQATIATANVKVQLDISFGDPVTPAPHIIEYPALRKEHAPVQILGYPLPTILAEKLTTAIDLGDTSTRLRDYSDIWTLTRRHDIDGDDLTAALTATATHRGVTLRPLSQAAGDLAAHRRDVYSAYRRRNGHHAPQGPGKVAFLQVEDVFGP